jgi:hypothetical protein
MMVSSNQVLAATRFARGTAQVLGGIGLRPQQVTMFSSDTIRDTLLI